jgi:hypothetical protein
MTRRKSTTTKPGALVESAVGCRPAVFLDALERRDWRARLLWASALGEVISEGGLSREAFARSRAAALADCLTDLCKAVSADMLAVLGPTPEGGDQRPQWLLRAGNVAHEVERWEVVAERISEDINEIDHATRRKAANLAAALADSAQRAIEDLDAIESQLRSGAA